MTIRVEKGGPTGRRAVLKMTDEEARRADYLCRLYGLTREQFVLGIYATRVLESSDTEVPIG